MRSCDQPTRWVGRGLVLAIAGAALLVPSSPLSAAPTKCPDYKNSDGYEVAIAIRATGTTCTVANRVAARTKPYPTSGARTPWTFRYAGFTCKGGWTWADTRRSSPADGIRPHSEGVGYTRWRCTRKGGLITLVGVVIYGQ